MMLIIRFEQELSKKRYAKSEKEIKQGREGSSKIVERFKAACRDKGGAGCEFG